jgi:hypothetical protein
MSGVLSDVSNHQLSSGSEDSDSAPELLQSAHADNHFFTKVGERSPAVRSSRKECSSCSSKKSRFCATNFKDIENDKGPNRWTTVLELFPWVVGFIWIIMQLNGVP